MALPVWSPAPDSPLWRVVMERFWIIVCLLILLAALILTFGAWIMTWGWLITITAIILVAVAIFVLKEI